VLVVSVPVLLHLNQGCLPGVAKHLVNFDVFFKVFLMFFGSFDCQLWAIFHFGTLNE